MRNHTNRLTDEETRGLKDAVMGTYGSTWRNRANALITIIDRISRDCAPTCTQCALERMMMDDSKPADAVPVAIPPDKISTPDRIRAGTEVMVTLDTQTIDLALRECVAQAIAGHGGIVAKLLKIEDLELQVCINMGGTSKWMPIGLTFAASATTAVISAVRFGKR